jgi:hypothetical protein
LSKSKKITFILLKMLTDLGPVFTFQLKNMVLLEASTFTNRINSINHIKAKIGGPFSTGTSLVCLSPPPPSWQAAAGQLLLGLQAVVLPGLHPDSGHQLTSQKLSGTPRTTHWYNRDSPPG